MSKHMRPSDITAQIRMERQRHKGAFLLFEGTNDIKRFKKFFDGAVCSFVNCLGKDNVLGAIEDEQNAGREDVLGFADADFDRALNVFVDNDDVIFSQCHDFDLDISASDAIHRYFDEVADGQKVDGCGGCLACVNQILDAIKPLSAMRFANERHQLGYCLKDVRHDAFFDGHAVDVAAMINSVSQGRFSSARHKAALLQHINRYHAAAFDLGQFTNGHDFFAALGIALRSRLGNRQVQQTWRSEVEKHLRLTFDVGDFQETGCLPKIKSWEARSGFQVLKG
jgi:hypothetical protein